MLPIGVAMSMFAPSRAQCANHSGTSNLQSCGFVRRAVTLVELLVAITVTLLLLGGLVRVFGVVSDSIETSRARLGIDEQVRHVRDLLQDDLAGLTALGMPPLRQETAAGYTEVIEGMNGAIPADGLNGDTNDILMCTTRGKGSFAGKFGDPVAASPAPQPGPNPNPPPPPSCTLGASLIVDNADAGFSKVGTWTLHSTAGYAGTNHYAASGSGSNFATWTFSGLVAGEYEVSVAWVEYTNRATNSPYQVLDGSTQVATAVVNQKVGAVGDHVEGGRNFQTIAASVAIASGSLVVKLTNAANGYVIADAVRIECVGGGPAPTPVPTPTPTPTPEPAAPQSSGGFGQSPIAEVAWFVREGKLYRRVLLVSPDRVPVTTDPNLFFNEQDLSAHNEGGTMKLNSMADLMRRENRLAHTASWPHEVDPNSLPLPLGGPRQYEDVVLDNVVAFDVKLWDPGAPVLGTGATGNPPAPGPVAPPSCTLGASLIVDNADAGFSKVGTWTLHSTAGYAGSNHYAAAGSGSNVATWTFSGLEAGEYEVSVAWVEYTNRATNSPFQVLDGSTQVATAVVNQKLGAVADHVVGGRNFQTIAASVAIASGSLVVKLNNAANGYVIADAVRIECVGGGPAPTPAPTPTPTPTPTSEATEVYLPGQAGYKQAMADFNAQGGSGDISIIGYGGFVDMYDYAPNYSAASGDPEAALNAAGDSRSSLAAAAGTRAVYDTWTTAYEKDKPGIDGVDNDGDGQVDEDDEATTAPPYRVPLKGVQITLRVLEPDTGQVREVTVVQRY